MMVRLLAAVGLARPEDLVPLILRRDPRFIIADVGGDVTGPLFDRMSTFDPADRAMMQRGRVEACGVPAAFNLLVSS